MFFSLFFIKTNWRLQVWRNLFFYDLEMKVLQEATYAPVKWIVMYLEGIRYLSIRVSIVCTNYRCWVGCSNNFQKLFVKFFGYIMHFEPWKKFPKDWFGKFLSAQKTPGVFKSIVFYWIVVFRPLFFEVVYHWCGNYFVRVKIVSLQLKKLF